MFVALLRACQPDGRRLLVRQALDVLVPALARRFPQTREVKYPIWIRYIKKVMVEEGNSINHLIHLFQLIVRHPAQFYPCR